MSVVSVSVSSVSVWMSSSLLFNFAFFSLVCDTSMIVRVTFVRVRYVRMCESAARACRRVLHIPCVYYISAMPIDGEQCAWCMHTAQIYQTIWVSFSNENRETAQHVYVCEVLIFYSRDSRVCRVSAARMSVWELWTLKTMHMCDLRRMLIVQVAPISSYFIHRNQKKTVCEPICLRFTLSSAFAECAHGFYSLAYFILGRKFIYFFFSRA